MSLINLAFLTDNDEHQALSRLYWELDLDNNFKYKVSEIAKQFGIPSPRLNKVVNEYCNAYSDHIRCSNCGEKYAFSSRSDFQQWQSASNNDWLCDKCTAIRKEQELKEKQELEEEHRKIVRKNFDLSARHLLDFNDVSFDDAIGFLALVRLGASEDFGFIAPIATLKALFAPSETLQYETLKRLYHNHLIYVHPNSEPRAFEFEAATIKSFFLDRVMWALPIGKSTSNPKDLVTGLEHIFLNMDWPDEWYDQRLPFCKKVALEECLQYLKISLDEHKFQFKPGEKTNLVINNLLEDFSVAQIHNFIWRAARDAAAFYVRERVAKQHAANTVVGSIQRQGERARSEGWDVKPYHRDFRCPQSMISQVLYNTALHIGDEGFNKPLK
jgi:hypothetical protein